MQGEVIITLIIRSQPKNTESKLFVPCRCVNDGNLQKSTLKDKRTNTIIGWVKWKLGTETETELLQR